MQVHNVELRSLSFVTSAFDLTSLHLKVVIVSSIVVVIEMFEILMYTRY